MSNVRYVAICLDQHCLLDIDRLKAHLDGEVYFVDPSSADLYEEIDMAILGDLHRPVKIAFIGGDVAKDVADTYWSLWIEDSETVTDDVMAFWDARCDDPWNLPTGCDLLQFKIANRSA